MHRLLFFCLMVCLVGCGSSDVPVGVGNSTTNAPVQKPNPTAKIDVVGRLSEQIKGEGIDLLSIEIDGGAIPVLKIKHTLSAVTKETSAQATAQLELNMLTMLTYAAEAVEDGADIKRVEMSLILDDGKTVVGVTRVSVDDIQQWRRGELTDKQFQLRWSSSLNTCRPGYVDEDC